MWLLFLAIGLAAVLNLVWYRADPDSYRAMLDRRERQRERRHELIKSSLSIGSKFIK